MSLATVLRKCDYDPTRDKSYRETALGRPIVDYLGYKQLRGRSDRTLDDKERCLASLALMYPSLGVAGLASEDLLHWVIAQPLGSRRHRSSHVNDFFKWAVRWDLIERNPMDKIESFTPPPQKVIDVFADPEIALLTGLPEPRDRALMQILFDQGLRKAEARNCQLQHFRDDGLFIDGKGKRQRLVPVTPQVEQAVNEVALLDGMEPTDHLWYSRPGGGSVIARTRPIGDCSFQFWWQRCIDLAGVRYRNPHTTRHTFATRYLRKGGDIVKLKRLMGHASIKTTDESYTHLDTTDLAAEFAELFGSIDEALANQLVAADEV